MLSYFYHACNILLMHVVITVHWEKNNKKNCVTHVQDTCVWTNKKVFYLQTFIEPTYLTKTKISPLIEIRLEDKSQINIILYQSINNYHLIRMWLTPSIYHSHTHYSIYFELKPHNYFYSFSFCFKISTKKNIVCDNNTDLIKSVKPQKESLHITFLCTKKNTSKWWRDAWLHTNANFDNGNEKQQTFFNQWRMAWREKKKKYFIDIKIRGNKIFIWFLFNCQFYRMLNLWYFECLNTCFYWLQKSSVIVFSVFYFVDNLKLTNFYHLLSKKFYKL